MVAQRPERSGDDPAELVGGEPGHDGGALQLGGVDHVQAGAGAADVERVALPADAPDRLGVVAVVDPFDGDGAQQHRVQDVAQIPELDAEPVDHRRVGAPLAAVVAPVEGDLMRLRLAIAVRALEGAEEARPVGVGDVPEGVLCVAREEQRAVHHRGLVVLLAVAAHGGGDDPADLARVVGAAGDRLSSRADRRQRGEGQGEGERGTHRAGHDSGRPRAGHDSLSRPRARGRRRSPSRSRHRRRRRPPGRRPARHRGSRPRAAGSAAGRRRGPLRR